MKRTRNFTTDAMPLLIATVLDWEKSERGTRRGFVDIRVANVALTIRRASVHRFDSATETRFWLTMPLSSFAGRDGRTQSSPTFWFSRATHEEISDQVFGQLKRMAPEVFAPKKVERAA